MLVFLSAAVATCAGGCKSVKKLFGGKAKPSAPPVESLLVYYKLDPASKKLQLWSMNPESGGSPQPWFTIEDTGNFSTDTQNLKFGPGYSLMARDEKTGAFYYTFGKRIFRYNPGLKAGALLAEAGSGGGRGIERIWLSRDGGFLLALLFGESGGADGAPEYVQVNTKTGDKNRITPADGAWDNFDFYNRLDFCYIDCKGKTYNNGGGGGGAVFRIEERAGAKGGRWPLLIMAGQGGKERALTDGMKRVLAARWTASGKFLVFIISDACDDNSCEGELKYANATGEVSQSGFRLPAEAIFNISRKRDAIWFAAHGAPGAQPRGLMFFDFSSKPQILDPDGYYPVLFEVK